MKTIARGLVISIVVAVCIMIFTKFIYFFPWYMTLVMETFNVSQTAATYNYMPETEYEDALDRLRDYPFFDDRPYDVSIEIKNASGDSAVGLDDPTDYNQDTQNDTTKPYRQKGEPITVTVSASYPFEIELWGKIINKDNILRLDIPVTFTLKTVGLKHYKDWDYYSD